MSARPRSSRRDAELLLRCLYVRPSDRRTTRLREAVSGGVDDAGALLASLERHGVLPLVARNLHASGAAEQLEESVRARLDERVAALEEDARRDRLTLRQVLELAHGLDLPVVLLKGASLAIDVYPEPGLRSQGDVDVMVRPRDVPRFVAAAAGYGLVPGTGQFPDWWYRLTHFHLKLRPSNQFLRELELHWRLQSPSLLLTPGEGLWDRLQTVSIEGRPALVLDPLDRLLHLATHLESHWGALSFAPGREVLLDVLVGDHSPVRMKWVLDVAAVVEDLHARVSVSALVTRAQSWGATHQLARVLALVLEDLLEPEAQPFAKELIDQLRRGRAAPGLRSAPEHRPVEDPRRNRTHETDRPLPGLDLRAEALSHWPRWFWPGGEYLVRQYGSGSAAVRFAHATRVLARTAIAAAALPLAFVGRALLVRRRQRTLARALAPERVLSLVVEWRRSARSSVATQRQSQG